MTIYKMIKSYPAYKVGSDGSVWTKWTSGNSKKIGNTWKQMKPVAFDWRGYLRVTLCNGSKNVKRMVHHLVLEAFIGRRPEGMECRHFPDPNPSNNNIENLSWGTHAQNQLDRFHEGRGPCGVRHWKSKLTEDSVRSMRLDYSSRKLSFTDLSIKYKISRSNACDIVLRKTWRHVA